MNQASAARDDQGQAEVSGQVTNGAGSAFHGVEDEGEGEWETVEEKSKSTTVQVTYTT